MSEELPAHARQAAAIAAAAADERLVMAAVQAVTRSHPGYPVPIVVEALRRQLDARGLDGWRADRAPLTVLVEEISRMPLPAHRGARADPDG